MVFHSAERNYKTHRRQAIPSPLNLLNPLKPLNLHAAGVSKGDATTLGPKGPIKPKNLKNLRPARAVNPHAAGVSIGDTTTLSPERAVQLKNPRARQGLSNFGPFGPVNPHAEGGL